MIFMPLIYINISVMATGKYIKYRVQKDPIFEIWPRTPVWPPKTRLETKNLWSSSFHRRRLDLDS